MRRLIDWIYGGAAVSAAACIVLVCLLILARVIGRWFGIVVPSSDDFAGYLLAASSFLGLAYTFRTGGHIQVSLFISRFSKTATLYSERTILILASALTLYLTYHLGYLVWESWLFKEMTTGYVPVPLWLMQLPVAIGMAVFSLAIFDQTYLNIRYRADLPGMDQQEPQNTFTSEDVTGKDITGKDITAKGIIEKPHHDSITPPEAKE